MRAIPTTPGVFEAPDDSADGFDGPRQDPPRLPREIAEDLDAILRVIARAEISRGQRSLVLRVLAGEDESGLCLRNIQQSTIDLIAAEWRAEMAAQEETV